MNKYTPEEVDYAFGGINELSDDQRIPFANAVSILDKKLVDKIIEEIYFVSSNPTTRAFQLPLNAKHLQGKKSIIFLSEGLFSLKKEEVARTILHEVAHHILKHKCLFNFTEKEILKTGRSAKYLQEDEADELVKKWISR